MSIEDLSGFFLIVDTKSKLITSDSPSFNHIANANIGSDPTSKKYFYTKFWFFVDLRYQSDFWNILLEPNTTYAK